MADNDVSSDADILAQFWTDWAASADYLMFKVSDFIGQQERLVQQVLARCPQGNDRKHGGESRGLVGRAECIEDVDSHALKGRGGGETSATAAGVETGGISLLVVSAWDKDSMKDRETDGDLVPFFAGECMQVTEVAQPEVSALAGESRNDTNGRPRTTSAISKYDQLKASRQRRTDKSEKRCDVFDAWQSKYDELSVKFQRQREVERSMSSFLVTVLPSRMLQLLEWWFHLEEPPRRGWLSKFAKHRLFNYVVVFVIFLNTGFAIYLCDYGMTHEGRKAPNETAIERAFLLFFALEMGLKIWVHKLYFFCNRDTVWNMFDFLLVTIAVIDLVTTYAVASDSVNTTNLTFARIMRGCRLGRSLRMLRAVKFLRSLRVILISIVQSFGTFVWSFVMMFMICFTFSLLFVQQISEFTSDAIHDGSINAELLAGQQQHFGSVYLGTRTLLMVAMGGADWGLAINLIQPLGNSVEAAFVIFVVFFNFSLMNILAGMFLDVVVRLSKPDNEEQITEAWMQEAHDMAELCHIVEAMDVEKAGVITKEAFVKYCSYPQIQLCFAKAGIDVGHPENFFSAAADNAGSAGVHDFVAGALHMKSSVTNADIQRVVFHLRALQELGDESRAPWLAI